MKCPVDGQEMTAVSRTLSVGAIPPKLTWVFIHCDTEVSVTRPWLGASREESEREEAPA